jgi:hypothetical protein
LLDATASCEFGSGQREITVPSAVLRPCPAL